MKRKPNSSKPGSRWRVGAYEPYGERHEMRDKGIFDELVVDEWLHVEQMSNNTWWISIGGKKRIVVWVTVGRNGQATRVTVYKEGKDINMPKVAK